MNSPTRDLPPNPMKFDKHTTPVELLPAFPLMAIATGFGYGAVKYEKNSWRNPENEPVDLLRTYGSVMRHLMKWSAGEEKDTDSKLPHLWLAGCQLMILIEHAAAGRGPDSRHVGDSALVALFEGMLENPDFAEYVERRAELLAKKESKA